MTLQKDVASLRADVDAILYMRVPELEASLAELAEDMVFAALFTTSNAPPPPPREHTRRHRSRKNKEARPRKKESTEMAATR